LVRLSYGSGTGRVDPYTSVYGFHGRLRAISAGWRRTSRHCLRHGLRPCKTSKFAYSVSAKGLPSMAGGSSPPAVWGWLCSGLPCICPTTSHNISEPDFSQLKPTELFSVHQKSLEQKLISYFICTSIYIYICLLGCENPSFTAVTRIRVEPVRRKPSALALRDGYGTGGISHGRNHPFRSTGVTGWSPKKLIRRVVC
jgi:hypothetical protein